MKFDCNEISINDEEMGCSVSFSEKPDDNEFSKPEKTSKFSIDEELESMGKYILLQRTYPESEFEEDNYYLETSNQQISSELKDYKIDLSRTQFSMVFDTEFFEINIRTNDKEFQKLKAALQRISDKTGELSIHEY